MTKLSDHISGGKRIVEGATFDPEHLEVLATFCYEAVGDYDWDRDECTTRPRRDGLSAIRTALFTHTKSGSWTKRSEAIPASLSKPSR